MDSMMRCYSQDMYDEYEKLVRRTRPPWVEIDNEACKSATVIRVNMDSANKHGILLEIVQVFADLNLIITKAYISSDGEWFMDVFYVTDQHGNKMTDDEMLDYINKSLGLESSCCSIGHTTCIELIGCDRPGLLSEVTAVLTSLQCNVVDAEVWTHNGRAAAVMNVTDEETGVAIADDEKLHIVQELLRHLIRGTVVAHRGVEHTERRLHQMMFADRDYDVEEDANVKQRPDVSVVNLSDRNYSVVTISCKDRPKLMFDTVFTLTDMDYVVFHANIDAQGPEAYQEYYIRHIDGSQVRSEAEGQRIVQCLKAAIERRVSEGLKFELCTTDRVGLLSDVTRIFRENSLTITRAEVTTRAGIAVNTFYVRGASASTVDANAIDNIRQQIGETVLKVEGATEDLKPASGSPTSTLFGGFFKSRSFCNLGLITSCNSRH